MKRIFCLILSALLLFGFAACGGNIGTSRGTGRLNIVCTLFPLYDFTKTIVGDLADVTLLLPPGVESHDFEPTAQDMVNIRNCDLFIRVGESMEVWSQTLLDSLDSQDNVLDLLAEMHLVSEGTAHDHSGTHTHVADPHIWTSPQLALQMVETLQDSLCALDVKNASQYQKNAAPLLAGLASLDTEIQTLVSQAEIKTIVFGSSFALRNFTDTYGLNYISAYDSCGEHGEPNTAVVAQITKEVKQQQIPVIFKQEIVSSRVAESIAAETGAQVLLFHTCHNVTKAELDAGATYLSLMQQNIANLKIALNVT